MAGYFDSVPCNFGTPHQALVESAFGFLFPGKSKADEFHQKFVEYVNERFRKLGFVVLGPFWESPYSKCIGSKEVIIKPRSVQATRNCKDYPHTIFSL